MSSAEPALGVAGGLAILVVAVYAPILGHGFVEFDDPLYLGSVSGAPAGFGWAGLKWAFTNADAYLFHPLTWISYRASDALHGQGSAGPWLLPHIVLHAASAVVLFRALWSLSGAFWASAFAAGLFALHPVQVESVAWVSARKELLAGFFFTATLWAYAAWVRRGGLPRYGVWNGLAILGLLSKGTLVTLPFVLVLLDGWPLRRLGRATTGGSPSERAAQLVRRLLEKAPLVGAAAVVLAIGFVYARPAENVWIEDPPLLERLASAPLWVLQALGRLLWPTDLAISYPSRVQMGLEPESTLQLVSAFLALAVISGLALAAAARRPYGLLGWAWFVGMLVPVLGIVPAGLRTLHDRYLYLPMIGIAIALSFAGAEGLSRAGRRVRLVGGAVALCGLLVLAGAAGRQTTLWRSSEALFDHAIEVSPRNAVAHFSKGIALAKAGRMGPAAESLRTTLEIHPRHVGANTSYGYLLLVTGRPREALDPLRRALEARPGWPRTLMNLGHALIATGDVEAGLARLDEAVRANPGSAGLRYALGAALADQGRDADAIETLRAAIALHPEHADARNLLESVEQRAGSSPADRSNPGGARRSPSEFRDHGDP